ncbi:MAG: Cof-type HAD-IIB family hydrolase, partial [Clostridiales bacterium]|nr:Cof-type HAD-IIB family hydrolase [Clostridiales bacterium]
MYKIVFLDIDETMVYKNGKVPYTLRQEIDRLESSGIRVCLNTGRTFTQAERIADEANIVSLSAFSDGLLVYDMLTKSQIFSNEIPAEIVAEILLIAEKCNMYVEVVCVKSSFRFLGGYELVENNWWLNMTDSVESIDELRTQSENCVEIILRSANNELLNQFCETINSMYGEKVNARDNLWESFVFVTPKDAGKEYAMKYICDYYNISLKESVAFGDDLNDIEMIKNAGLG